MFEFQTTFTFYILLENKNRLIHKSFQVVIGFISRESQTYRFFELLVKHIIDMLLLEVEFKGLLSCVDKCVYFGSNLDQNLVN